MQIRRLECNLIGKSRQNQKALQKAFKELGYEL